MRKGSDIRTEDESVVVSAVLRVAVLINNETVALGAYVELAKYEPLTGCMHEAYIFNTPANSLWLGVASFMALLSSPVYKSDRNTSHHYATSIAIPVELSRSIGP